MALQIPNLGQISKTHPVIYEGLRRLVTTVNALADKVGVDPYTSPQQVQGQTVSAPGFPTISVQVSAGSFEVSLGPPPSTQQLPVLYFLEMNADPQFPVQTAELHDLGNQRTYHALRDGSKTWYFRARARFQSSSFGPYIYYGTQAHPTGLRTGAVSQSGNLLLKNVGQAVGVTSSPTTSSTSYSLLPDMSQQITTKGNPVFLSFSGSFANNLTAANIFFQIWRDGQALSRQAITASPTGNQNMSVAITFIDLDPQTNAPPRAGTHLYEVMWRVTSGTATGNLTDRQFQVVELG